MTQRNQGLSARFVSIEEDPKLGWSLGVDALEGNSTSHQMVVVYSATDRAWLVEVLDDLQNLRCISRAISAKSTSARPVCWSSSLRAARRKSRSISWPGRAAWDSWPRCSWWGRASVRKR